MCGIAGLVGFGSHGEDVQRRTARMSNKLTHRGPDDVGSYYDPTSNVGLVHRRLSILDLSEGGHQPMHSDDGRYVIVFNGEIYNFRELRSELERDGIQFKSHSDTEVLLRMYQRYGVECPGRLIGMFAFAIWDRADKELFVARGPFGIKPLYYWFNEGAFAFASEIRSLLEADLGPRLLNGKSLYQFLVCGTPQEPETLVQGIETLEPGHYLLWKAGSFRKESYWQIQFPICEMSEEEAIAQTREALEKSIVRHFVSDVPVGIFLSGGIDSTAILALARAMGYQNLHTYCISFEEQAFNEGPIARRTAEHFGAVHHEWKLTATDARNLLPEYSQSIDQPSIDGFNVFCVSKFARRAGLKVVLSGLGGDELFGSYPSFSMVPKMLRWHGRFDTVRPVRMAVGKLLSNLSWNQKTRRIGNFLMTKGRSEDAYQTVRGTFSNADARQLLQTYVPGFDLSELEQTRVGPTGNSQLPIGDQVSFLELTRYMLNQLLRDSDVMSMANGLELRVPFVDSDVMNAVGRIPSAIRLRKGKQLLLDAVPEIPEWVANCPKRGFAFPFESWIHDFWGQEFSRLQQRVPVPLSKWYHKWALFSLELFLKSNGIKAPTESASAIAK